MDSSLNLNFFVTVVLPVLSLIVAILIAAFQNKKKSLSYYVVSEEHDLIRSTNLDMPIKKIVICYTNSGDKALQQSDFYYPITTEFIDSTIVSAEEYKTISPDGIKGQINFSGSLAEFTPDLMNKNESIYFSYYVSDFNNKIHVETKIIDGKSIMNKTVIETIRRNVYLLFGIYISLFIAEIVRNQKISLGLDFPTILLLYIPILYFMIKDIKRVVKSQHVIYYVWEPKTKDLREHKN